MNLIIKIIEFIKNILNLNKMDLTNTITVTETTYQIKPIMTDYEKKFYNILKTLEDEFIIIPQLNLASIIQKKNNNRYYSELFRNIDFAIFDKKLEKILLLIEIDDKTHNSYKRKDRDLKIKKICNDVNLKLIHFYTKYPNEPEYVLNRIKNEIYDNH